MHAAPVVLDHVVLVAVFVVAPMLEAFWLFPLFKRVSAAGRRGVRPWAYAVNMLMAWGFTGVVIVLWVLDRRPWTALHLGPARPLGLALGLGLSALYIGVVWRQVRALLRRPDGQERLRRQFANSARQPIGPLLPRTPGERRGFALVSFTAGICEELLYRGYLMWYCAVWTGPIFAVVISSVLFGFGHVYLGVGHVVRTAIVGVVFALIVLATGSLWPAMLLHAVLDLVAGEVGYRALSEPAARVPAPV